MSVNKILEAFDIEVLHTQTSATIEINDPEVVAEIEEKNFVTLTHERGNIYTLKSRY